MVSDANPLLHLAMIGTRGVPAAYGGFETAVEEIGRRLVDRGHAVTVYCRADSSSGKPLKEYLGMRLVTLPAIHAKSIETLSHTALSVGHALGKDKPDMAFVFNAANAPFVPLLQARGIPAAVHVDGLEWKRGKWGKWGKKYYRFAESTAVRCADALIADAPGIADYYAAEFAIPTELLTYGAPIQHDPRSDKLSDLGLEPRRYHLVVARFEPENHVDLIVDGYARSHAQLPLVVVGSAPYAAEYTDRINAQAAADPRIHMLGGIWDQDLLDQLYANALTYLHGHMVGGTNPSLLRAMGAGTAVIAYDVVFNRDVLGEDGVFFSTAQSAGYRITNAEASVSKQLWHGHQLQTRAAEQYNWDDVAAGYELLAQRLAAGKGNRGRNSHRRIDSIWSHRETTHVQPVVS